MAELLPVESIALTIALTQVQEGRDVSPNIATQCVLALARLTGRYDWTADDDQPAPVRVSVPTEPTDA